MATAVGPWRAKGNFFDVYELKEQLGEGASSKVYRCRNRQGGEFAVKIIPVQIRKARPGTKPSEHIATPEEVERELAIMVQLAKVSGAVKLRHYFVGRDRSGSPHSYYIVMDLMLGSDVGSVLNDRGSFCEEDGQEIMRQVFACCAEMHERNVIHRDIKLENIMLSSPSMFDRGVAVADFGLAVCVEPDTEHLESCGTPLYIAPELLTTRGGCYGHQIDIWSCGVALFMILGGYPPFFSNRIRKLFASIAAGNIDFSDPVWDLVSDEAKDLIRRCLTVDPDVRISAKQALRHPWLSSGGPVIPVSQRGRKNSTF